MARKSMTTLKSEANSRLADNQVGAISPADVRQTRIDFLDTVTPGYGATLINPSVDDVSVGTTPQDITAWNQTVIETSEFTVNNTTGVITLNTPMVVIFNVNISITAPTNRVVTVQSLFSGSTFNYTQEVNGAGASDPVSLTINGLYDGDTADTLRMQIFADTATTVDFVRGGFIADLRQLINDPV